MNQDEETYEDLSAPGNFVALNRYTHKMLHYFFTYYKKDRAVLDRLKKMMDEMIELNCPPAEHAVQPTCEETVDGDGKT